MALRDGRVLMSGGSNESGVLSTAEILDADGKFLSVTPMSTARAGHACAALEDGTVLVAGGDIGNGAATNSAEIYDPVAANWRNLAPTVSPRIGATASVLRDGRVLIAGGEALGSGACVARDLRPGEP